MTQPIPYNPLIRSLQYSGNTLTLEISRKFRTYSGVPMDVIRGMICCQDAASLMKFYATKIKGKYEVNVR